ncbi:interferon-induced very large GTPase 1-like [Lampetra planeri]
MSGEEEEERSSQAYDELARKLRDVGLDEVYWKQKLGEVLLISSAQALLHLDRQECKELDSHFRKSWEKKAFYKIIGIDADDVVRDKEEMSLARIQNNPLPPVVSERRNEPTQMSNSVSRHCRSDEEILRNASGGLALEGVYMSGKLEDKLEKRGKLLTIPQTIQFVDPVHTPMTQQHEFISFSEESVFEKGMKVMGFSSTVSEQGCVSTLSREPISMPNKSLNLKKMQNVQTDHSHISRTEYTYLPLASAHLQMAQIRLSDAALKELQNIENTLENTKADFKSAVLTSMIRNFFHLFGSHANEGPLEFGGIFWRKASAQGFGSDQQDEMKRLLSELLGSTIGADCDSRTTTDAGAAMITEPASSSSGQHGPVLTDMVKMTVTTIGGDPGVHDLPQWKAAVVSNNRTWSLIERGSRFIPVWDIVLSNHKCDFKDVLKVASDLITAYAILTNKHANNYQDDALAATIVEAQSIMQDVRQWMISDDITHLDKLGNLKQKFYECTQTNRSWIDACLSHPSLNEYLNLTVLTCKHSSRDEPKQLKMKIQRLLEPNIYAVENFPQRSSITQWVYGTDTVKIRDAELKALANTFTETKKRLKQVMDSPTSETAMNVAKVKGTNDVTFSLNSLFRCLREMQQLQEEELFIAAAAASGFSATERLFHRVLDYEDVDCIQHEVGRAYSKYSALGSQSDHVFAILQTERFMNLLERLDLHKYYPKKMRTGDVCVVKSAMCTKHPNTEQELASYYLQKLIMGDYEARYVRVQSENKSNETMINNANSNYEDFFKHDDTLVRREGLATNTNTHIHPMDLQMTIYHCGDNFVRQYLYTKLSLCQFALPLLVPNPCSSEIEFPLWAFRQINKNWKCRDTSTNTLQTKSCAIVNADTPLVSFIRFGESPTSKSQMLNSLLGKQRHGVFFHRHCKGSSRNGLLMEGVTEVAWYFPGGRDDDVFNDCIAFTNLHGDARRHRKQVQFLHEISSINVILMSDRDHNDEAKLILQECLTSPKPLVSLCADQERIEGGHSSSKVKIAVKNRNEADLMDELEATLNSLLANSTQTINLDDCSNIARWHSFTVDEDDENCKEGKSKAGVLLSLFKDKPLSSLKETFLPLQGELWHEWCKKDKEFSRLRLKGDQSIEQYRDTILIAKRSIRRKQLLRAFPLKDVMKSVIEVQQHQPDTIKKYFLHWIKTYLDRLSAECLPQLHQEYHKARREIVKSKKKR